MIDLVEHLFEMVLQGEVLCLLKDLAGVVGHMIAAGGMILHYCLGIAQLSQQTPLLSIQFAGERLEGQSGFQTSVFT